MIVDTNFDGYLGNNTFTENLTINDSLLLSDESIIFVGKDPEVNNGITGGFISYLSKDNTFGTGYTQMDMNISLGLGLTKTTTFTAVALQSDGKIIVAGEYEDSGTKAFVQRYVFDINSNLKFTLDTTFNSSGNYLIDSSIMTRVNDIAVHSNETTHKDKIVVVGYKVDSGNKSGILRLSSSGAIDTGFSSGSSNGYQSGISSVILRCVTINSDDKIFTGGANSSTSNGIVYGWNANGKDSGNTEGINYKNTSTNMANIIIRDIIFESDNALGYVIVVGEKKVSTKEQFFIGKIKIDNNNYLSNGNMSFDSTFGTSGSTTTEFTAGEYHRVNSLAVDANGKYVVAGIANDDDGSSVDYAKGSFGIVRYNTDGSIDTSFGTSGKMIIDPPASFIVTNGANSADKKDEVETILIQSTGNIIVLGNTKFDGSTTHVSFLRLTNGTATTSNICFPAGTMVYTDQGEIAIEKINTSINTINNMSIDKITKTFSSDSKLVLIKKDAFGLNKPIRDTLTSCLHKFRHNGVITEAYKLINGKTIQFADYKGQALYNVLLKTWEFIKVNNIEAETLHPDNIIAKLHKSKLPEDKKVLLSSEISKATLEEDYAKYELIKNHILVD